MAAKDRLDGNFGSTAEELKKIGNRIRALRIAQGYANHEKFANEKGLSRSQYWRYENGMDLKMSSFITVLRALDVTFEEFFSEGC